MLDRCEQVLYKSTEQFNCCQSFFRSGLYLIGTSQQRLPVHEGVVLCSNRTVLPGYQIQHQT